jgi:hypothetical protein
MSMLEDIAIMGTPRVLLCDNELQMADVFSVEVKDPSNSINKPYPLESSESISNDLSSCLELCEVVDREVSGTFSVIRLLLSARYILYDWG